MYGKFDSFVYAFNHAINEAGYRERYAMEHGNRKTKHERGHTLWVFRYSADDEYQDANGATFDVTEGRWIN